MNKTLEIEITREDAEKANEYVDTCGCLLAQAILRTLNPARFEVFASVLVIDGKIYKLSADDAYKIHFAYDDYDEEVDLSRFKPFTITATLEDV